MMRYEFNQDGVVLVNDDTGVRHKIIQLQQDHIHIALGYLRSVGFHGTVEVSAGMFLDKKPVLRKKI